MTNSHLLIGSLSNDLFRVASLTERGSSTAAIKFLQEAKRWSLPLEKMPVAHYITKIAKEITRKNDYDLSLVDAERYLMYGILLQNYALHHKVE